MNRFFWLLNGALVVVGLLVTLAAVRFEPTHPTLSPAGVAAAEPRTGKTAGSTRQPTTSSRLPPRGPSPEVVEVIWKQSLFRPDRGEDGAEGGAATAENARTTDMELVGIGQINGEGAAIILIQNSAGGMLSSGRRPELPDTPGTVTPFGRRGAGVGSLRRTSPGRTGTAARSGGESSGQTHVFRVNQRVGTSGFVVKEVRIDTVVLLRGAEERVLKLDRNDTSSKTRQESATREAMARVPAAPPPPPTPGSGLPAFPGSGNAPPNFTATGQPAAAGMPGVFPSREERIRAAIETRRRLMEAQQPQNTPPRP